LTVKNHKLPVQASRCTAKMPDLCAEAFNTGSMSPQNNSSGTACIF